MKILHVTTDFPYRSGGKLVNYGGLGMCVLQLVEGLRSRGYVADVLSRSEMGIDGELFDGVTRTSYISPTSSRNWKLTHSFTLIPKLLKLLRSNNYGIVHVHNPPAGVFSIPLAKIHGSMTIMTMHGPWSRVRERMRWLASSIEDTALEQADAVTFDSNSLLRMYGNKAKYHAIPNAVDTDVFKHMLTNRARERFSLDQDKRVFLYSGRNVFGKNVEMIRGIAGKFPDDIFVVSGWQGNATDEEFGNITYLKSIPNTEMPWLYSACDGLILASSAEGMSRAVLEAMSCGCAPILSDIPSNMEVAGSCGRYFNSGSVLGEILGDFSRVEMAKIGVKCRERIVKEFSISKRLESFIKLYEGI